MGGMGALGGGPLGPPGPNNGEIPLTAQIEQSTAAAFQMINQVVNAFGGFAQMLESTFFATHSSFMAMVGVAEQMGYLRSYLGQALSAFTIVTIARRWFYRLFFGRGSIPPADAASINADEFEAFNSKDGLGVTDNNKKKSKRPLLIFLIFMVGLPWLMSKLIARLQRHRLEQAAKDAESATSTGSLMIGPDGRPLQPSQIKDLEFCRALYDFRSDNPAELSFVKGDIIAILSKTDPVTNQLSMWWRGRLRSGAIGYFPSNYVEVIDKGTGGNNSNAISSNSNSNVNVNTPSGNNNIQSSILSTSDINSKSIANLPDLGVHGFTQDDFSMKNMFDTQNINNNRLLDY